MDEASVEFAGDAQREIALGGEWRGPQRGCLACGLVPIQGIFCKSSFFFPYFSPMLNQLKKLIEPVAARFQMKLVVLFGSMARGRVRSHSDIDLAFLADMPIFEDPGCYAEFMEALEPLELELGRQIDSVAISSRNLLLLRRILKEGILLYEYRAHYYRKQRLHWRFLVEDNYRVTLNYSRLIQKRLVRL
jgi:predicted nucleotidyltransferase